MSLTNESMTENLSRIIPDFKTASGQKPHIDGVGQKRALALCRVVHAMFSNRDHDQPSVDVLMKFFNDNVKCAWRYIKYEQLGDDQVQERIADFEHYKTPEDLRVIVHAGDLEHDIGFEFLIGAKKFSLEFFPGDTIEETQPVEDFEEMDDATPEQMYGSELCYYTVSGYFIKEPESDEEGSDRKRRREDSDDESSSGDSE
jgi:hypothetical protein